MMDDTRCCLYHMTVTCESQPERTIFFLHLVLGLHVQCMLDYNAW